MSCYSDAAVISCHRPRKYGVEYYLITDTIHKKSFMFLQTNVREWQSSLALHRCSQLKAYCVASE